MHTLRLQTSLTMINSDRNVQTRHLTSSSSNKVILQRKLPWQRKQDIGLPATVITLNTSTDIKSQPTFMLISLLRWAITLL